MTGMLAFSLAGHDAKKIYIIIEETDEYVFLCDGVIKTIDRPKKKRKKHIQIVKKEIDASLQDRIRKKEKYTNEEIKRAIKLFRAEITAE